jgi:hypothetical protein
MLNLAVGMNQMIEICLGNLARVPERRTLKPQRVPKSNTCTCYNRRPRNKRVHGQPRAAAEFTLRDQTVSVVVTRNLPGHEVVFGQYICVPRTACPSVIQTVATHVRE